MIVKIESLIEDFPKILSQIGLENKVLYHLNPSAKKQLSFYLCNEAVSIIKSRFKNDFLTFGYSSEVPSL
jgi:hypothetical protein